MSKWEHWYMGLGLMGLILLVLLILQLENSKLKLEVAENQKTIEQLRTSIKTQLDTNIAVSRGTKVDKPNQTIPYTRKLSVQATAYTHTGNPTRTGVMPKDGRTIAVDPKVIPLGSKVYIEGVGVRICEDTGGAIKGNIIDIFMDDKETCLEWGRRNVTIYILEEGN